MEFIECPECGESNRKGLFRCWKCKESLNPEIKPVTPEIKPTHVAVALSELPSDQAVSQDLGVCRACGAKIRNGLVRCSECRTFTRPEIERIYREKVDGPE